MKMQKLLKNKTTTIHSHLTSNDQNFKIQNEFSMGYCS